jgi:hypothetical protein
MVFEVNNVLGHGFTGFRLGQLNVLYLIKVALPAPIIAFYRSFPPLFTLGSRLDPGFPRLGIKGFSISFCDISSATTILKRNDIRHAIFSI